MRGFSWPVTCLRCVGVNPNQTRCCCGEKDNERKEKEKKSPKSPKSRGKNQMSNLHYSTEDAIIPAYLNNTKLRIILIDYGVLCVISVERIGEH